MDTLKIGIIGFGEMAQIHAQAVQNIPNTQLVAVADPDSRKAEDAKAYGCTVYNDTRVMLREAGLDIAIVATQAPLHCDLTIAALQKGIHVICEKPMALSLEQADEMVEAARTSNRLLAVNHQWVFMDAAKKAAEIIQDGSIGELQYMEAYGKGRIPAYDLMEIAGHTTHLMYWLAGPVEWMTGHIQTNGRDIAKEDARPVSELYQGGRECGVGAGDYLHGYYKFRNGICGSLYLSSLASTGDNFMSVELRCTKGRLKIYQSGGGRLLFNASPLDNAHMDPEWTVVALETDWNPGKGLKELIPATGELIRDFIQAIQQYRKPQVSGEDGCAALEMGLGIYTAHLAGERLTIPLADRKHPFE